MRWSGKAWFFPAGSEGIFHEVKTEGLLFWAVYCHTAGVWLLNRRKHLLVLWGCTSFVPILSMWKPVSVVSLDISTWHQHIWKHSQVTLAAPGNTCKGFQHEHCQNISTILSHTGDDKWFFQGGTCHVNCLDFFSLFCTWNFLLQI